MCAHLVHHVDVVTPWPDVVVLSIFAGFASVAGAEAAASDHEEHRAQQLQQGGETHPTGAQQES